MKLNLITFAIVLNIMSVQTSVFASEACADFFRRSPSKLALDDLFLGKNETVQILFSTSKKNAEKVKKSIRQAWLNKGISKKDIESYTPTIVSLNHSILVVAKVTPVIYDKVVDPLNPKITEVSNQYLSSIGLAKNSPKNDKISSDLQQIFSYVNDKAARVPTTIVFPSDSDVEQNEKMLAEAGLSEFQKSGKKIKTKINKDQFTFLAAHSGVQEIDLQY